MTTRLLTLLVRRRRRDWLLVRHRARQVAALLGYSPEEQATLAATAFELSRRACETTGRLHIHFDLAADKLLVLPEAANSTPTPPLLRLELVLPPRRPELGTLDLPFVIKQLVERTPLDVLKEIERQNMELLRLAAEARKLEAQILPAAKDAAEISAA